VCLPFNDTASTSCSETVPNCCANNPGEIEAIDSAGRTCSCCCSACAPDEICIQSVDGPSVILDTNWTPCNDATCTSGWCRLKSTDSEETECVEFQSEGQNCGGYTLPQWYQRCNPDTHICLYPEGVSPNCIEGEPCIADAPGSCTLVATAQAIENGDSVVLAGAGNSCPDGYAQIHQKKACKTIGRTHSTSLGWTGQENTPNWPSGCYHCDSVDGCTDGTWFNKHTPGSANGRARLWCQKSQSPTPPPTPTPPGILFAGDSDISEWFTDAKFPNSKNVGVGGWTCKQLLKKIDTFVEQNQPDWVVVVCGENDMAYGKSPSAAYKRFRKIVNKITAAGARVLYMGTKPEPDSRSLWRKYRKYDKKVSKLAAQLSSTVSNDMPPLVMIDVYKGFKDVGNNRNLYQSDRLHLSSKGYKLWNEWAHPAIDPQGEGCYLWRSGSCRKSISDGRRGAAGEDKWVQGQE